MKTSLVHFLSGIWLPDAICRVRGLSPGAKLIYCYLKDIEGSRRRMSIEHVAEACGLEVRSTRRYINELCRKKFIEQSSRESTSSYSLIWNGDMEASENAQN